MSLFRRGDVWWYEFWFAGRRIQESSKSPSKTIAKTAEQNRKRELEEGFNNFTDTRHERVRTFSDMAEEYLDSYKLRLPQSARFAEYAIDHLKRILGSKMLVDFSEAAVIHYQNAPGAHLENSRAGSVTQNSEPWPGSPSTHTSPL